MKVAYHPLYVHPVPGNHKFPMDKYSLIREAILHRGICEEADLFEPKAIDVKILEQIHSKEYINALFTGNINARAMRKIGFEYSKQLIERERVIVGGTLACSLHALEIGYALNIAGGTHHAYANSGEGFCLFNDFAVAAKYLLDNALARQILIIDLDVHQGNGSARIFENTPQVFTFSMHGADNYPLKKEGSDLDVHLPFGITDQEYLNTLKKSMYEIEQRCQPDFVFYQSGVDVLATDKLGKMALSAVGCKQRDDLVFEFCKNKQLPVVVAMGGGYSPRIADIVNAHCNTFESAREWLRE